MERNSKPCCLISHLRTPIWSRWGGAPQACSQLRLYSYLCTADLLAATLLNTHKTGCFSCATKRRRMCAELNNDASVSLKLAAVFCKTSQSDGCTVDLLADNPFNTLKLGCDFLRHHALPQIDFATAHLWPDTWLPAGAGEEAALRFARRWVNVHADVCTNALGKPLVLAEFGTKAAGRPAFYEKAREQLHAAMHLGCRLCSNGLGWKLSRVCFSHRSC